MFRSIPPLLLCSLALPLAAQDATMLTPATVEVTKYDQLMNQTPWSGVQCCAPEVLASGPDVDFVHLRIAFDVAWSETVDKVNINANKGIAMKLPGQDDPEGYLKPWGSVLFTPTASLISGRLYETRPRDWPGEAGQEVKWDQAIYAGLFSVPVDTTEATLILGEPEAGQIEVPLDLSGAVVEMPAVSDLVDLQVDGISVVEAIPVEHRSSDVAVAGEIRAMLGKIVKLDVTVTPQGNMSPDNQEGHKSARFDPPSFNLVGPEGLPLAQMGQQSYNRIAMDGSNVINWYSDNDEIQNNIYTFYFLGSGAPGAYQVYFLDEVLATATLE